MPLKKGYGKKTPEMFERYYHQIGWRKGPYATPEMRKAVRDFWIGSGSRGTEWLVKKIAKETHGEILEGAAGLLSDIGPSSIGPIARVIETGLDQDNIEILLKVLGWIGALGDGSAADLNDLERILEKYQSDDDPDLREAACAATGPSREENRHAAQEGL